MIEISDTRVTGWEETIRGMRNPKNSWANSDSETVDNVFQLGKYDQMLMLNLRNAGTDHRKFMRMITVYADINAPLYWWKEFDTYKVGTVANSCSTMHKIHAKPFTITDFSFEHIYKLDNERSKDAVRTVINALNWARETYLETGKEEYWWQMIQLLPSSYMQKRTVMMNYEVLANIYNARRFHRLDEWRIDFIGWIKTLPFSELITGGTKDEVDKC